jgi:hypothetical protein
MLLAYILLAIALALTIWDRNSLLLTLAVGCSYFLPVELITSRPLWVAACIVSELTVLSIALYLQTQATKAVGCMCGLLVLCHLLGWYFSGFDTSTYASIVYQTIEPYLEYMEILACIVFSKPVIDKIFKGTKCLLKFGFGV